MKLKIILSIILVLIVGFSAMSYYYTSTDRGHYAIFLKNTLGQIEHVAKARDSGVEIDEVLSWYDKEWQEAVPVIAECTLEGINYVYSRPELTPSEIRKFYKRVIESKKDYWMGRIKSKKK